MKLLVISHKPCWTSPRSPSGCATDGGFPFQIHALSQLFEQTTLLVPVSPVPHPQGETPLAGKNLRVAPLRPPPGRGARRKLLFPLWTLASLPCFLREIRRADAIHAPIPGDVGTIGQWLALAFRKPLFIRHCGNWLAPSTLADRFWKWSLERIAGGRNVVLATGGGPNPPSRKNPHIHWIFSTSLTRAELNACATHRDPPPANAPRLIIVCRQEIDKGTGAVIESLPSLLPQFPGLSLDVVGHGGALNHFKTLAASLGVQDRVAFHGNVDHPTVIRLLRQAHAFCFPTRSSEGFPKAVLEAMACGLPVIASRVSVLPQLLGGGAGLLLNEPSASCLAGAIAQTLANPEAYSRMSAQAILTASRFSLEAWGAEIGARLQASWPGRIHLHHRTQPPSAPPIPVSPSQPA